LADTKRIEWIPKATRREQAESEPALRVFATHEMAARGATALAAIRGVLDGSMVNPFGHPYRTFGEVYRCALISARMMGIEALCLEPLLRDAVKSSTGACAAEAIQALREVGWKDDETLLVLTEALEHEVDVAAEAVIAIIRAGKRNHPLVVTRLESSPRARNWMDRFAPPSPSSNESTRHESDKE
jgi:hypothetical protein